VAARFSASLVLLQYAIIILQYAIICQDKICGFSRGSERWGRDGFRKIFDSAAVGALFSVGCGLSMGSFLGSFWLWTTANRTTGLVFGMTHG
jgi:hypothetical protein